MVATLAHPRKQDLRPQVDAFGGRVLVCEFRVGKESLSGAEEKPGRFPDLKTHLPNPFSFSFAKENPPLNPTFKLRTNGGGGGRHGMFFSVAEENKEGVGVEGQRG